MDRQAYRATVVGQRAGHRLAYPPVDVGAQSVALTPVELFDARLEPDVAFLDEILQAKPAAAIMAGDRDDQSQVGLDQTLARSQSGSDLSLERDFLLGLRRVRHRLAELFQ